MTILELGALITGAKDPKSIQKRAKVFTILAELVGGWDEEIRPEELFELLRWADELKKRHKGSKRRG